MRKIYSLVVLLLVSATQLMAQTGTLQGKVTDGKTGEGMSFAQVVLLKNGNQVMGVNADIDGFYAIKPIVPGTYELVVTSMGYNKAEITGIQITADAIEFKNVSLSTGAIVIKEHVVSGTKLIDPGQTATVKTVNREQIQQMAGSRSSPNDYIAQAGGVVQFDKGGGLFVNGSRGYSQKYYIDGMAVRGSITLPPSAIEQISLITGGVPARYGDATGGIINITTRGPSKTYEGGLELGSSYLIDADHYRLVSLNLTGPIYTKYKSSRKTANDTSDAKIGFFANVSYEGNDGGRSSVGWWKVKDNVLDSLQKYPLRQAPFGKGFVQSAEYVTKSDMERIKVLPNTTSHNFRFAGKVDYKLNKYMNLTIGGNADINRNQGIGFIQQLFDPDIAPFGTAGSYRGFVRFNQRFAPSKEKTASVFQNAFYSIQADYTKNVSKSEDRDKGFNPFVYGYIGKFQTYRRPVYGYGTDTLGDGTIKTGFLLLGYQDTLVTFTPSDENPLMANYTKQMYVLAGSNPVNENGVDVYGLQNTDGLSFADAITTGILNNQITYYNSLTNIVNNKGLINGMFPSSVYSMWLNTGAPVGGYSKGNNDQFRLAFYGSVDLVKPAANKKDEKNRHAVEFGVEYEQRADRGYNVSPVQLWGLARQLANKHILTFDTKNPIAVYKDGVFQDTLNYNRLVGTDQSYFDKNLRKKLGLDENGTDFIDIDALDPSQLSLDMFSPDELRGYVGISGYDYLGNRLKKEPSFEDYLTKKDANGNYAREIGAFRPIYAAAYLQDKFSFRDLIFNIGIRVDRYDANEKVLKDPYVFYATRTAGEVTELNGEPIDHPSTIGSDYVVYVNDMENPTQVVGYRSGDNWFTADGTETTNPKALADLTSKGKITPYLANNDADSLIVTGDGFEDYTPQFTFMPRVAFSFPISDEAQFIANYDVLSQRPSLNRATAADYYWLNQSSVGATLANPALKPEKTINYMVGFKQKVSENSVVTIKGLYRELKDLVQIKKYVYAFPTDYNTYGNEDFGTVKSLQVEYEMRRQRNVALQMNYTLQFADGTGDSQGSSGGLIGFGQKVKPVFPFYYDRRHSITAVFDYRFSEGSYYDGPRVGKKKLPIFANTGVDIVFNTGSGTPYSKQSNPTATVLSGVATTSTAKGTIHGSRLPWTYRFDLKMDKNFKVGKEKNPNYFNVYLYVQNILNTKNVFGVYAYTGNPDDDGYLSSPVGQQSLSSYTYQQSFIDLYDIRVNNPDNYSDPRVLRMGLSFNF